MLLIFIHCYKYQVGEHAKIQKTSTSESLAYTKIYNFEHYKEIKRLFFILEVHFFTEDKIFIPIYFLVC